MKILVLNCGSSSIKYKLFDMDTRAVMAQGGVEKIGLPDSFLQVKLPNGEKVKIEQSMPEHTVGIQLILNSLIDKEIGCLQSLEDINAVGHRVVHGGEKFNQSVLITPEVKEMIVKCIELAPLHNPANLKGIEAIEQTLPNVPQVAVFDTAFHQTMPDEAYMYALPYELYEKYAIRRYGFHGTSHRYVSARAVDLLGNPEHSKVICCHLGNGSSLSACVDGKVVDTTMGLGPLAGVPMGTRSGDIDAAVVQFLCNKYGYSVDECLNILNKKSGVLALSGNVSSDFRDLASGAAEGNEDCQLALDKFAYEVAKYVGAYAAALNGLDVLTFTACVGENDKSIRAAVCEYLGYLGVKIDPELNKKPHEADANGKTVSIPGGGVSGDSVYIPQVTGDITIAATTVKEDSFYWKAVTDDFAGGSRGIDAHLFLGNRRRRFKGDAERDGFAVGNAALDAAGAVGKRADFAVAHFEGVVLL